MRPKERVIIDPTPFSNYLEIPATIVETQMSMSLIIIRADWTGDSSQDMELVHYHISGHVVVRVCGERGNVRYASMIFHAIK